MIILLLFFLTGVFFMLVFLVTALVSIKQSHSFKKACKQGDTELAQWYYDKLTHNGKIKPSRYKRKLDKRLQTAYINGGNR